MNSVYLILSTNIKFALMQEDTLIQYVTLDYSEDSLTQLYALMKDKQIMSLTVCLPSYFSQDLLQESAALRYEQMDLMSGYFCVSLEDISKIEHLAKALQIPKVGFLENRDLCIADGIYIFENDNAYNLYVCKNEHLLAFDVQTDSTVERAIRQYGAKYGIQELYNYVNHPDFDKLPLVFSNVFGVSDQNTLSELTYLAALIQIAPHSSDDYRSAYVAQDLVGYDTSEFNTKVVKEPDARVEQEISSVKEKKAAKAKVKEEKPSSKFGIILVATIALAIGCNFVIYNLSNQQYTKYLQEYDTFTKKSAELSSLQSRYTMFSAQTTTESGQQAYDFIKKSGLSKKSSKVKLNSFIVEGSTVSITVSAKSDDVFWEFYDKLDGSANVSSVTDESSTDSKVVHTINLIL